MLTIEDIISDVEKYYKLVPGSVKEINNSKSTTKARHIAMILSRKHTESSYPEIGDVFHRHHSSVMNAVKKENLYDYQQDLEHFNKKYSGGWFSKIFRRK